MSKGHKRLEKNIILMSVFVVVVVSLGGLVEILPLIFQDQVRTPSEGIEPYPPLQLAGRDIYIREGYDRPFQWGSKRTGPDLARVGARYSDEWHVIHLINPRDVVPESNMPGYPWLLEETLDGALVQKKMTVLQTLGDPYTDAEIAAAADAVNGKTEMEALVAYLQGLGRARSGR